MPAIMLFAWLVRARARPKTLIAVAVFVSLPREDMALWIGLVLFVGWRTERISARESVYVAFGPVAVALISTFVLIPEFSPTQAYLYGHSWDITSLTSPVFTISATFSLGLPCYSLWPVHSLDESNDAPGC